MNSSAGKREFITGKSGRGSDQCNGLSEKYEALLRSVWLWAIYDFTNSFSVKRKVSNQTREMDILLTVHKIGMIESSTRLLHLLMTFSMGVTNKRWFRSKKYIAHRWQWNLHMEWDKKVMRRDTLWEAGGKMFGFLANEDSTSGEAGYSYVVTQDFFMVKVSSGRNTLFTYFDPCFATLAFLHYSMVFILIFDDLCLSCFHSRLACWST